MKFKKILFLFALLLSIQFMISIFLLQKSPTDKQSTIEINELSHLASSQWESLQHGSSFSVPDRLFDLNYTIISNDGTLLFQTREDISDNLYDAIVNRDTILDVITDNQLKGKLIIWNNTEERLYLHKKRMSAFIFFSAALNISFLLGCLFYFYRTILKPFQKLNAFAVRVADGNLDLPLQMDQSNIFGAFTESFDIMRLELKKSREQERLADKSKKELVAKLSHDIKTPVASITAIAELLSVKTDSDKEREQLFIILKKASQIDHLISDLFHASLEELRELKITPSVFESSLLHELLLEADYMQKTTIEPIPPCLLVYDKLRLLQVFDNIISNSYKYADTSIHISFQLLERKLSIRIKDFGPGICSEEIPLIFNKFYRGSFTDEIQGFGLGLYISHYLVTEMGGTISCIADPDGFCIKLTLLFAQ